MPTSSSGVDDKENGFPRKDGKVASQKPRSSKNESITFRIFSESITRLRKEANEEDISMNTLVNQILKNHISWHSVASKAGFISVERRFVKVMIDKLSEEEVTRLAMEIATTSNRDLLMILRNEISLDSAIDFIESWLRICGFAYRREADTNGKYSFVIQHDMGRKWSLYLGELYKHLFEDCKASRYSYDARESLLSFTIEARLSD